MLPSPGPCVLVLRQPATAFIASSVNVRSTCRNNGKLAVLAHQRVLRRLGEDAMRSASSSAVEMIGRRPDELGMRTVPLEEVFGRAAEDLAVLLLRWSTSPPKPMLRLPIPAESCPLAPERATADKQHILGGDLQKVLVDAGRPAAARSRPDLEECLPQPRRRRRA